MTLSIQNSAVYQIVYRCCEQTTPREEFNVHTQINVLTKVWINPPQFRTNSEKVPFVETNLIHNFLYKLHKFKFLYMFRASSAHLQEVNDVNCTCMQPPAENEDTSGCIHVQLTSLTSWRWVDDTRNMYRNLILCNLYKNCVSSWYQ